MLILGNVTINEIPTVINRVIEGNIENVKFKLTVTNNILIPHEDGTVYLNVYNEWIQIIGKATSGMEYFRWESPIINKNDMELKWREEANKFFDAVKDKFKIIC